MWEEDRMMSVDSNFNFLCGRPHGAWPPSSHPRSTWAWPPPCGRHKWMKRSCLLFVIASCLQEYKSYILSTVAMINDDTQKRTSAEERWVQKWKTAVEKVKQLYQWSKTFGSQWICRYMAKEKEYFLCMGISRGLLGSTTPPKWIRSCYKSLKVINRKPPEAL